MVGLFMVTSNYTAVEPLLQITLKGSDSEQFGGRPIGKIQSTSR